MQSAPFAAIVATLSIGSPLRSEAASKKAAAPKATTTTTAAPTTTAITTTTVVDLSQIASPAEQCVASGPVAKGVCARIGLVNFQMTGDISGPAVWAMSTYLVPSTGRNGFTGVLVMENATVAGCGTGTITIVFGPEPIGTPQPAGIEQSGFWRVVVKSQSSPLANLQGQGQIWADPPGPGPLSAHLKGLVKC